MSRTTSFRALSLSALALTACTQFPDLEATQTQAIDRADYPALVPIEPILARADGPPPDPTADMARLNARLTNLRARAGRIRGAVLSGAERLRLENGLR